MGKFVLSALLVAFSALLFGCGGPSADRNEGFPVQEGAFITRGLSSEQQADSLSQTFLNRLAGDLKTDPAAPSLTIAYPLQGSVFPPDLVAPRLLWEDPVKENDTWLIDIDFGKSRHVYTATQSPVPPPEEIDSNCITSITKLPAKEVRKNWRSGKELWKLIKAASKENETHVRITGFNSKNPSRGTSLGDLVFKTSRDSVGAPVFYRDVPIMPAKNKEKKIQPLSKRAQLLIAWRLRDLSRESSKVVMKNIHSCANCHSFSPDGKYMGMDVDGPQNDKGAYAFEKITRKIAVYRGEVITWNAEFEGRRKDTRTLGFLSQVSPSGDDIVTTVNEKLFVSNFMRTDFLQVFYPTRGQLATYNRKNGKIRLLPGADDTAYVHCDAVWTPDGKYLVFARAASMDPWKEGQPKPTQANGPEETQIQYNLYRIPFNGGRGGKAEPIKGASHNGMSNNFPKVSPDGRFVVFVQCRNGQLMRPDGRLFIVPIEGGEPRLMNCNTSRMNSWHTFSPNGRWMAFSSKANRDYTQLFLTHIDENGMDTPPILVPNSTAANRAVNIPEFVNIPYDSLEEITMPAVEPFRHVGLAQEYLKANNPQKAVEALYAAMKAAPEDKKFIAEMLVLLGWTVEDPRQGLKFMQRALKVDPGSYMASFDIGVKYLTLGDEKNAILSLRRALEIKPDDPLALGKLAEIHAQSKDPGVLDLDTAVALAFKACDASYFKLDAVLVTLGRILHQAGRSEEAARYLREAAQLHREEQEEGKARELEAEAARIAAAPEAN